MLLYRDLMGQRLGSKMDEKITYNFICDAVRILNYENEKRQLQYKFL